MTFSSSIIDPSSENNGITHARINALQSAAIVSGLVRMEDKVTKRLTLWVHQSVVFLMQALMRRARHHQGHRIARQMLDLDESMLQDLGLSRADVRLVLKTRSPLDPTTRLRILSVERRAVQHADQKRRNAYLRALLPCPFNLSGQQGKSGATMPTPTH